MNILHFLINCYFILVLGIAGIAKIDSPQPLFSTLRHRYKFSQSLSSWISKIFPWGELLIAIILLLPANLLHIIMSGMVVSLFLWFLLLNSISYYTSKAGECGCYGEALKKRGITVNISTTFVQCVLSVILFLTAIWSSSLPQFYYLISTILFTSLFSWLLWKTWQRHQYQKQNSFNVKNLA
jgi:hypothetical protein